MFITTLLNVRTRIQDWSRPFLPEPVPVSCETTSANRRKSTKTSYSVVTIGTVLAACHVASPAWSADLPSAAPVKPVKTVAAGFGFQDADTSSITVKTYDAASGEVLSAETYELDIKDDGPPSSHPRARIFAGGVGVGADGLSEFTLRVYDAANGRFLW